MEILLSPPLAFLIYIPLVLGIVWFGKQLAGPETPDPAKSSLYGSGEEGPYYLLSLRKSDCGSGRME